MSIRTQFAKNLIAAFMAQGVTLLLNVIMSLVVPKVLGVREYGYWQLFVFYSGYVGFFHFGLIDGIYLKLGGKKYQELDHKKLGQEYKFFIIVEIIIAAATIALANIMLDETARIIVFVATAAYMVLYNATLFLGYIFQAVNETKTYSFSVIIDRLFVLAVILLLLLRDIKSFVPFVAAFIISKIIALVYVSYKGRQIVFSKGTDIKSVLQDMGNNVAVGSNLMFANIASMLILGIGRIVIDQIWGIEYFGKISFSLSMTNFFLMFIQQVSMVLFPMLRKFEADKQVLVYTNMRTILGLILPAAFVFYVPIKLILILWLPEYSESLDYLALLLPICTFDGKMQMLYNTYLKVLREEKKLFQINTFSFIVSGCLAGISGFVLHNFLAVVLSMLFAVAFRSVLAETYLSRKMNHSTDATFIGEILMVVIFVVVSWNFDEIISLPVTVAAYIVFLLINRSKIIQFVHIFRNRR